MRAKGAAAFSSAVQQVLGHRPGWMAQELAAALAPPDGATKAYKDAFKVANEPKSKPEQIVRAIVTMIEEFATSTAKVGRQSAKGRK
jgi:hypothetical protein